MVVWEFWWHDLFSYTCITCLNCPARIYICSRPLSSSYFLMTQWLLCKEEWTENGTCSFSCSGRFSFFYFYDSMFTHTAQLAGMYSCSVIVIVAPRPNAPFNGKRGRRRICFCYTRFLSAMATDVNHFCEDSRRYSFVTNLRSLKHKKSGLCIVVVLYSTIAFFFLKDIYKNISSE